ncbi:DUF4181 domain-containing protein [Jeotgalibacillus malaysiensis]|uniref:DUF4181 domain-containing protein n=1 Tax=Jeotgalibacillus malaysiensis TaxID=1508404 RepID=UPI00384DB118
MNFLEGASTNTVFLVFIIIMIIVMMFRPIMRRVLGADKFKIFSYDNYVNKKHKKFDWIIRITTIIGIITLGAIQISTINRGGELRWYLWPYIVIFAMIPLTESLRAYMEWKYAENRNNYKVTLLDLGLLVIITIIIFATGFFGAFDFGW